MGRGVAALGGLALLLALPGYVWWAASSEFGEWTWLAAVPSVLSFAQYAWDKRQAQAQGARVPEAQLLGLDLLGGWPGGFLAQRWLRHKTAKMGFQFVFWLIVAGQETACVLWLLR